jgi:hypothetical protein
VVADFLKTFDTCLPLENLDNAEWIRRQWVEMFLKQCTSEVLEARKKGRRGNKGPGTDLQERPGKKATANVPDLPNRTFMVVIRRVLNGNNNPTSSMQFQALYTDVRRWKELIDLIEINCSPKQPYGLTAFRKCNLTQDEWDEEYMGLYAPG